MTFQEFWIEVEKTQILSNTTIQQIPWSLSNEMKYRLADLEPLRAAKLLEA